MKGLFLVEPNKEYQESFREYVLVYRDINDKDYYKIYEKSLENFEEYINDLYNYSLGINLPEGMVKTSTFWMIDNDVVIGVVRVRHQEMELYGHIGYDISPYYRNKSYGTQILRLALQKAKEIGIKEPIITCEVNNIASKKTIEKNNGKLLDIIFDEKDNVDVCKYSITIWTS